MKEKTRDNLIVMGGVIIVLAIVTLVCLKVMKIDDKNQREAVNDLQTDKLVLDKALQNYINSLNSGKKEEDEDLIIDYKYEDDELIKEIDAVKYFKFTLLTKCNNNIACLGDSYDKEMSLEEFIKKEVYVSIKKSGYTYVIEKVYDEKPSELE